jgi:predicted metal-dependent hydrolase
MNPIEPMQNFSPRQRPAAALDNPQLDLPFVQSPSADTTPLVSSPTPLKAPDGSKLRELLIGERALRYWLKRSSRRTIGFTIDGTGLAITAPRWVTIADIENAIIGKEKWIFAKLDEWQTRMMERAQPRIEWRDGAQIPFLGQTIGIMIAAQSGATTRSARFDADTRILWLGLPPAAESQQIRDRVQRWLKTRALDVFTERLPLFAAKLGVTFRTCALSSAATRWGSCSSDGKIRLNWRLIHFPVPIIDYVVAHELSHLREMNHSPRFWATVESIYPEYREARHTLKHHPPELLPMF